MSISLAPLSSYAATLDDVVNSINNVWTLLASSISTGVATAADLLYEENPNLPNTITVNSAQPNAIDAIKTNTTRLTQDQIKQALTQSQDLQTPLAKLLASDSVVKNSPVANIESTRQLKNPSAGDANMSFQSLIGPNSYESSLQLNRANNFIRYAANMGIPFSDIRWSTLSAENKEKLDSSDVGKQYKVLMRSAAAAQSVALDNLNNILSERTMVKGLGTKAGMTKENASPLEVSEFIATRRTRDQNWYNSMAKASPATLQRETLFVLAEMQQQLYQQHLDNERILATLSVTQLQTMQTSRLLNRDVIEEVKKLLGISGSTPPEVESAIQELNQEPTENETANDAATTTTGTESTTSTTKAPQ